MVVSVGRRPTRWTPIPSPQYFGRHGDTRDGIERFWRSIVGGSASTRFHRPDSGLGISDVARTHIRAARDVTDELDIPKAEPRPYVLSDRTENESYCIADGGPERLSTPDSGYWVAVVRT